MKTFKIGTANQPLLLVCILNFYFQMRKLQVRSTFVDVNGASCIYLTFSNVIEEESFTQMYSKDEYKNFINMVFKYVLTLMFTVSNNKSTDTEIKQWLPPIDTISTLLLICGFKSFDSD